MVCKILTVLSIIIVIFIISIKSIVIQASPFFKKRGYHIGPLSHTHANESARPIIVLKCISSGAVGMMIWHVRVL